MSTLLPFQTPPSSICILRLSALGDVVHTIPVVRAIQQQWPDCKITWICGQFEYKLLRLLDGVEFITFNKKDGLRAYQDLRQKLGKRRFDVLLHMQVAARANFASMFVRADVRLGWDKARSRDLHHLFINHSVEAVRMQHQQDGFLSFARALGLQAEKPDWQLPVTDNARHFVNEHLPDDQPYIVISPCSSHKLRNWSAQAYAEVADYVIDTYGLQVVISGGPSSLEQDVAAEILANMKHQALNLVGKDTLEQLLGLLSRSRLLISPDSGPAHIANALGIPVLGLYACTWSKRSGPYNSLQYCVDEFENAADKYLNKKAENLFWGTKIEKPGVMDLIRVTDVKHRLEQILSK